MTSLVFERSIVMSFDVFRGSAGRPLGKVAKLEVLRRLLPLFLAVLGLVGFLSFMTPVTSLACVAVAIGIYAALPLPRAPSGVIQPDPSPPVWGTDLIGFLVGVPFISLAMIGLFMSEWAGGRWMVILIIPGLFCIPIFLIAVRHRTSWVRFFGNGFEFADMGMKTRVRYVDLQSAKIREWQTGSALVRAMLSLGSLTRQKVALLSGTDHSRTLVFTRKDGTEFAVSSEVIPDLQRILIGMDRAGVELPDGFGERERKKIRKKRQRLYRGSSETTVQELSPREQALKITALLEQAKLDKAKSENHQT